MAVMNVNPTRMQLGKLKKQLATATRGHKMLKDKRDELMRQFLDLIREDRELRAHIEERLSDYNRHMDNAGAVMSAEALSTAMLSPKQQRTIELSSRNVMSVDIPSFHIKERTASGGDIFPYGFAFTSFELDDAITTLNNLVPDMIHLAEIEKSCELLSAEIEKSSRRVNSLEHVMIPRYQDTIKYISMKLEENDRSSRTRLMKVKDMLLEKAHHYNERLAEE